MANGNIVEGVIDLVVTTKAHEGVNILNKQLEKATKELREATKAAGEFRQAFDKVNTNVDLAAVLEKQAKAVHEVNEAEKQRLNIQKQIEVQAAKLQAMHSKEYEELVSIRNKQAEYNKGLKDQAKANDVASSSLAGMRLRLIELRKAYDQMDKSTRNSSVGKNALKDIQSLNKEILNLEKESGRAQNSPNKLGSIFSKLNIGIGAVVGGLAALGRSFFKTFKDIQATGDGFAATVEGMKSGWEAFKRSIITGDFTNFFKNIGEAIRAGREFSIQMDEIQDRVRSYRIAEAEANQQISALEIELRNVNNTYKKRIEIADEILAIENSLLEKNKSIAEQEFNAILKNEAAQSKMNEADLLYYIKAYEENRELVGVAEEYLKIKEKISSLDKQSRVIASRDYSGTEGQTANIKKREELKDQLKLMEQRNQGLAKFANIQESYGRTEDEGLNKLTDSYVKLINVTTEYTDRIQSTAIRREKYIKSEDDTAKKSVEVRNKQLEDEKRRVEEQKRLALETADLQNDITQLQYKETIDKFRKIADSENVMMDNRIHALDGWKDYSIQSIDDQLQYEKEKATKTIENETLLQLTLEKLDLQAKLDREAIEIQHQDNISRILESAIVKHADIAQKEANEAIKMTEEREQAEYRLLLQKYEDGYISTEEYEKNKRDIALKYNKEIIEAEINSLVQYLDAYNVVGEERIAIEKRIAELRSNLSRTANDQDIASAEEVVKKREELEKELVGTLKELTLSFISDRFEAMQQSLDAEREQNQQKYDEEIANLERSGKTEEEIAAAKEVLQARQEANEKSIEQRKRALAQQQARFEKTFALMEVAANTAVGISKTLALFGPPPISTPFIAMISAIGAAQAAMIASKPIPQYKEGTDDHLGGPAIVGDGGRRELVIEPSGKAWITPSVPTLVHDLPKHSMVLPSLDEMRSVLLSHPRYSPETASIELQQKAMQLNIERLERVIRDNAAVQNVSVNIDNDGITTINENYRKRTKFINSKIHRGY